MNHLKKILGLVTVISCFSILGYQAWSQKEAILKINWQFDIKSGVLLLLLLILVFPINVLSWHILTKAVGMKISLRQNFRGWMLSNFGRYLPGSIWQYIGRAYFVNQLEKGKIKSISLVVMEILLSLFTGTAMAYFGLGQIIFLYIAISLGIVTILFCRKLKINLKYFTMLVFLFCTQFVIAGLILGVISNLSYLLAIGIYATGWMTGYLVIFAPAGLGVQELALTNLLSQWIPLGQGVATALALRVCFWLAEVCTLLFVFVYAKNEAKHD